MKRSALYILLFAAGIAVLFLLFRNKNPFGSSNTAFAVDPSEDITRIELISGESKVTIERSGEKWTVNGKSEARKSAVNFILKTLREIKIKSPVSDELFKEEITAKKIEPLRVNVFARSSNIKSFLVYKTASNKYGNIMRIKARSKAFIVYMPGYEDNIGSHFIVNELYWKPFTVFNLLPTQIGSVELTNFRDTSSSFTIESAGGRFSLKDVPSSRQDSMKVRRYISYFVSILLESWAFDLTEAEKSMIEESQPLYTIAVRTTLGVEKKLTIWERNLFHGANSLRERDTDRIWGKTDDGNGIFVMRYFDIDPVLKKRDWFIIN